MKVNLKQQCHIPEQQPQTITKACNIVWFNPSYRQNVKTNIRKKISQVNKKAFSKKS